MEHTYHDLLTRANKSYMPQQRRTVSLDEIGRELPVPETDPEARDLPADAIRLMDLTTKGYVRYFKGHSQK